MQKTIGVLAPSTPLTYLSEDRIQSGYSFLRDRGFTVVEHKQCRLQDDYMAGNVEERVAALHEFVADKSIDIIMFFWGGYNSNQMLDLIDFDLLRKNPKIFVGYSDATVLLNAITANTGIVTYLGPGIITFTKPDIFEESLTSFVDAISFEGELLVKQPDFFAKDAFYKSEDNKRVIEANHGWKIAREGVIVSKKILATNLSLLETLLGTAYEPDFRDVVLFGEISEEVGAPQFDRLMVHLRQAGVFAKISGFVFSKTTDASDIAEKVIVKVLKENIANTIPIMYDFDAGHTDPILTIPNGGFCNLRCTEGTVSLIFKRHNI